MHGMLERRGRGAKLFKAVLITFVAITIVLLLLYGIGHLVRRRLGTSIPLGDILNCVRTLTVDDQDQARLRFWSETPGKRQKGIDVVKTTKERRQLWVVIHKKGKTQDEIQGVLSVLKSKGFPVMEGKDPVWGHESLLIACGDSADVAGDALNFIFSEIYHVPSNAEFRFVKWQGGDFISRP